jgi:acetamidase/formamidase
MMPENGAGHSSRVYLPVLVEDALVFFGDPHAKISDGITGTGIGCSLNVRARIHLLKDRRTRAADHGPGQGGPFRRGRPSVEKAPEDAAGRAVDFAVARPSLGREEAYTLLSIIRELRVGRGPM